jgi:hypothetical protein
MTRYLSADPSTAVGEVVFVDIGESPGVSGRIDKATVTITGQAGTKTVTGARLRSVLNAGIIGEGGGIDEMLLSTKIVMATR